MLPDTEKCKASTTLSRNADRDRPGLKRHIHVKKSLLVSKDYLTWLLSGRQLAASQSEAMLEYFCKITQIFKHGSCLVIQADFYLFILYSLVIKYFENISVDQMTSLKKTENFLQIIMVLFELIILISILLDCPAKQTWGPLLSSTHYVKCMPLGH